MTKIDVSTVENWDEIVLPFQMEKASMRGRVARLDRVLDDVLKQHDYPAEVSALVAEAAMLTALIGQTIKLRWKLSLQIRGDGPIRIIATDYYGPEAEGEPARIRAYASFDADRLKDAEGSNFEKIGSGMFAILIDQGKDMQPYQGITPLAGGSLAKCAETYFAQSEQLPTRFEIIVGESQETGKNSHWRAGGVMVQHLPEASPMMSLKTDDTQARLLQAADLISKDTEEDWNRVNILLDTVEELELIGPSVTPIELLHRLFHEEDPSVKDPQVIKFGCSCSEEKVRQTMSIYSQKDIAKMTAENGMVTADCQFCGAHYELPPKSLGFEAE